MTKYHQHTLTPEYLPNLHVWLVSYWRRDPEEAQSVRHADREEAVRLAKREIDEDGSD